MMKIFDKENVFTNFKDCYNFINNKEEFIGISKDKKLLTYHPVKKGATIETNIKYDSFTKELTYF